MAQTQEQIAENRRRYDELRAAGQELTPKGLPEPTALDGARIAPDAVIHREGVPFGWYTTLLLRRGEALRIVDDEGHASVSLLAWGGGAHPSGSNAGVTINYNWG